MSHLARYRLVVVLAVGALALAAGLLLIARPVSRIAAQGNAIPTITPSPVPTATLSPTPNPTATAAALLFDVQEARMISRYPRGVEYVLRITSKAGTIQRASVAYWNRDRSIRSGSTLEWDPDRQAYVYYDRFFQPPWFEVHYRFRVIDSAGNVFETGEQVEEYADTSRTWTRREGELVIVLLYGARESLADDLFQSASDAIDRLEKAFGFALDYKPYVVVVPDRAGFDEWQEYPDPQVAGLTLSGLGYTIQQLTWGEYYLVHTVVPHELTHIFQGFITEALDIPTWFIEGQATYFEPVQDYDYENRVRQAARLFTIPSLRADMSPDTIGPDGMGRWAYDLGYTFIKYWVETYGWESHRLFWQAQVTMHFEEAMEFATGRTFDELESEWRAWIGAPGPAPTLIPTPTLRPWPTARPMATLPGM
jgi:hypothetical protein